jgi:predicted DNA-binding transcriptional regulator YafY
MLDRACRDRIVVDVVYESVDGETTHRALEPTQLHWDARLETLYLIAWCRLRQDIRFFATHRFKLVKPQNATFVPRPGVSSQAALKHAFRVWRAEKITRVRLRFTGRAARLVGERTWHASQKTRREAAGALSFEVEVAGLREITHWILSFAAECEVLEPATLRDEVREAHARAAGIRLPRQLRR